MLVTTLLLMSLLQKFIFMLPMGPRLLRLVIEFIEVSYSMTTSYNAQKIVGTLFVIFSLYNLIYNISVTQLISIKQPIVI